MSFVPFVNRTMIHASVLVKINGTAADPMMGYIFFPLMVHSFDLIVSGLGVAMLRAATDKECEDPLKVMQRAYMVAAGLALVSYFGITATMLSTSAAPGAWFSFFLCGLLGIVAAYCLIFITQYYTDYNFEPVRSIARASVTGHGTNVIAGLAVGFESTAGPAVVIAVTLLGSYSLGARCGLQGHGVGISMENTHIYIRTCIHPYIHTFIHSYLHSKIHKYIPSVVNFASQGSYFK